jgi:peptidyl-prolyl cis-trans isomerase A (cyclophilin A)
VRPTRSGNAPCNLSSMSLALLLAAPLLLSQPLAQASAHPRVLIKTSLGNMEAVLETDHAPRTVNNFLKYVDSGRYEGGHFHRTVTMRNQPDKKVKIEVIQGGVNPLFADMDFPAIELERTNMTGIKHKNGTISMARNGPNTATSDFFICINDQPALDFGGKRNPDGQGFAAFGRVTKGMDVVKKVQRSKSNKDQHLTPPIKILSITRIP